METKFLLVVALAMGLSACASVQSSRFSDARQRTGLVYYMPAQHIVVGMTIDGEGGRTFEVGASDPRPDFAAGQFSLRYTNNQAGTNKLSFNIGPDGLLDTKASGSSTPTIALFIKDTAGSFAFDGSGEDEEDFDICQSQGVMGWAFDPTKQDGANQQLPCGISISIRPMYERTAPAQASATVRPTVCADCAGGARESAPTNGVFYRQSLPYLVTLTDRGRQVVSAISVANSDSPTHFLPIPRSMFAKVEWQITFDKGIPTFYEVLNGGELQGALAVPGQVVAAYSEALAAGFKRDAALNSEEAKYLDGVRSLAESEARSAACRRAIEDELSTDEIVAACTK